MPSISSQAENVQLYQMIDVKGDSIRFEARSANGEHHDGVRHPQERRG